MQPLPWLMRKPEAMGNWFERKSEDWFGTPEKKMRLLQWLVYITNLYVIFGIFVLIWLLTISLYSLEAARVSFI